MNFRVAKAGLHLFFLVLSCAGLGSCGYHLAGGDTDRRVFSESLKRISVEGISSYDSLRRALIPVLRSYGFKISRPHSASARLIVLDKREKKTALVVGDDAKAREYLLTLSVRFIVRKSHRGNGGGKSLLLKEQLVYAETSYIFDPDRVLSSDNLLQNARAEARAEVVREIMRRLALVRDVAKR